MNRIRIIASLAIMTLAAGCSGGEVPATSETPALPSSSPASVSPAAPSTTATPSPTTRTTAAAPELTAEQRVYVLNVQNLGGWPEEASDPATILDYGAAACSMLDLTTVDGTAAYMVDQFIPVDAKVAEQFVIHSVMNLCPQHEAKLPG